MSNDVDSTFFDFTFPTDANAHDTFQRKDQCGHGEDFLPSIATMSLGTFAHAGHP